MILSFIRRRKQRICILFLACLWNGVWAADDAAIARGEKNSAICAACHGVRGEGISDAFPRLAGQNTRYLAKQLRDYQPGGARNNAVMSGIVAALTAQEIQDLAAYYAAQKPSDTGISSRELETLGRRIYQAGDKSRGVLACMACHGPAGKGNMAAGFPLLGGQYPAYTLAQLKAFQSGQRSNDSNRMMRDLAMLMSDRQMAAVADYLHGLYGE